MFREPSDFGSELGRTHHIAQNEGTRNVNGDFDSRLHLLREELDAVDRRLLESIRDRIAICERVAHVKREFDIPMMQPGRVGVVQERARDFADRHGLSADFLTSVFDTLIAEACRVEDVIIDSAAPSGHASNTQRR